MDLVDDFFLIVWGDRPTQKCRQLKINMHEKMQNQDEFAERAALILITNSYNISKFLSLDIFTSMSDFFKLSLQNTQDIQILQSNILLNIHQDLAKKILSNIQILHKEKIINFDNLEKLDKILSLIKTENINHIKLDNNMHENLSSYSEYIDFFLKNNQKLDQILQSEALHELNTQLRKKILSEHFSIGVTGIMNAGKSTLLNALLGENLLGTSVVPETANLSIISYDKNPHAKVNFWNFEEWEAILTSAKVLPAMAEFVKKTHEHFGQIDQYITKEGLSQDININELQFYTSAKDLKCNLVKSVQLYVDIPFLQNGVSIVDTPGLDDIVIQREEITKAYLNECDVMIHLMNVNQSATKKDVDFIIDTLSFCHISKLLIVLTQIDTISEEELNEVINYAKTSIENRLISLNQSSRIKGILEKIEFIPVSGKFALWHKTGKADEALKAGYDLEKTNITKIEKFLFDTLYSPQNDKNSLFISSIISNFDSIINASLLEFDFEKNMLLKNAKSLQIELNNLHEQNEKILLLIEQSQSSIEKSKLKLVEFLETLQNTMKGKFDKLRLKILQRLSDDISYEWRKNKANADINRLKTMLEFTLKDTIVDIMRDYRYSFLKRLEEEIDFLIKKIDFIKLENIDIQKQLGDFSKQYFDKNFATFSLEIIHAQLQLAFKMVKKGEVTQFNLQFDLDLKSWLDMVEKLIHKSLLDINHSLLQEFENIIKKPVKEFKNSIEDKEKIIQNTIENISNNKENSKEKIQKIEEKISQLNQIKISLQKIKK